MRRLWLYIILLVVLLFGTGGQALAADPPRVVAEGAALLDLQSGRLLWGKEPDKRLSPASTTKILTALVALEKGNLDQVMQASNRVTRVEGTRVYLVEGERKTLRELLYAMLLNSANDAAEMVAENVAGSVKDFAGLMNQRAAVAGARNSNFVNPHGLDAPEHYTTAYDLGLIAVAAMQNPVFSEIVATTSKPWQGQEWQSTLFNHNKLLGSYEGAIGVKTGYTTKSGQTLVAAARRGKEAYVAVVLDSKGTEVWSDARKILDYGFASFRNLPLVEKGQQIGQFKVPGLEGEVPLVAGGTLTYLSGKEPGVPRMELRLNRIQGPVSEGEQVGEAIFSLEGREVGRVAVLGQKEIPAPPRWKDWLLRAMLALLLLRVLDLFYRRRRRRSRVRAYWR